MNEHDQPKLRDGLEAHPVEVEGKRMILIQDGLGFSEIPMIVSPAAVELLIQMDGTRSLRDIQANLMRRMGELLPMEDLIGIVGKLDDNLFLENDRFHRFTKQEIGRFRDSPSRPAFHAGKSYPAELEALRAELASFFDPEQGGPGFPDPQKAVRPLSGLIAPHIDLRSGGPCFAAAYKASAEALTPPAWIVLGTGHQVLENMFALAPKDFETPLGLVRHDREACETLLKRAPRDMRRSEYNHLREHSVEFQAVFLAHIHPEARIVPLLCSFSVEEWKAERAYIDEMAALLRDLRSDGAPLGIIASVDLAHVGPRYGDDFRPDAATLHEHVTADRVLLDRLEECDAEGFMEVLAAEGNRRRVCGMAPLYVLAKVLQGNARGVVLRHSSATVDDQDSFVTYASLAFYPD